MVISMRIGIGIPWGFRPHTVADPEILKTGGDNLSACPSLIANAHNELYAFYTEKGGLLENISEPIEEAAAPLPLNLPLPNNHEKHVGSAWKSPWESSIPIIVLQYSAIQAVGLFTRHILGISNLTFACLMLTLSWPTGNRKPRNSLYLNF